MKALLKKNWIIWKRSLVISIIEILFPILLMSILIIVRVLIKKKEIPEISYTSQVYNTEDQKLEGSVFMHYPFYNDGILNITERINKEQELYSFFDVPAKARFYYYPEHCVRYAVKRNVIGITPRNDITMEMEKQLKYWSKIIGII